MKIQITLEQFCQALQDASDWHKINGNHDVRVSDLSVKLGEKIGLSQDDLYLLKHTAQIHDIGRVGITNDIMSKMTPLIESEYGAIKTHPEIGYKLIKDILPESMSLGVLHHHEYWNGAGYPKGLKGENIPLFSRVIRIPDVWDALTSDRPYRKALSPESAIHIMNLEVDTFDPKLYPLFLEIIRNER